MQNNFNISIFVIETENNMRKLLIKSFFACIICVISYSNSLGENKFFPEKDETYVSVVVIDPGHGGKDFGASVGNAKEKNIVLDIALKLGKQIKTNYPNLEIIYTRKTDVFIPLHERVNIANKNKADLFISIHANGVEQKNVRGTETFVLGQHRSKDNLEVAKTENSVILLEEDYNTTYEGFDPNSDESQIMFELVQDEYLDQSIMFASDIQDQFRERAQRIDRSVKMAGFLVLRRTTMPSVLIEAGFITNLEERKYMLSESGQTNIASAIFYAFKEYKRKIEDRSSFALRTETVTQSSTITTTTTINTPEVIQDDTKKELALKPKQKIPESEIYFSVQIAAAKRKVETKPSNFKGEKNIFRVDWDDISRYFSGNFTNLEDAEREKNRLRKKYSGAFVVAFENNELISVKKAQGKM